MYKLLLVLVLCTGCATNIGRALTSTFKGVDPATVEWVQFANKKMGRELKLRYVAVEQSRVTRDDGSIDIEAAQNRFHEMESLNSEIEKWEELCQAHANYLGISLNEPTDASEKRADERRRELFQAIYKGSKEALKEKKDE